MLSVRSDQVLAMEDDPSGRLASSMPPVGHKSKPLVANDYREYLSRNRNYHLPQSDKS